jgi:hypothetical protein
MELTEVQIVRRNIIIKDIIQKRPTLNACTYREETYYDPDRKYRRNRLIPNKEFFGYDPDELWTLGLQKSGWALTRVVQELYSKALTQKINRFDDRICEPLREFVLKLGITGLYSVRTSKNKLGFVHAIDLAEAGRVADVAYGYLIVGKNDRWGDPMKLRVCFNKQGTVSELNVTNQSDVESLKNKIKTAKREIENTENFIEGWKNDIVAIQMSEMSQLSAVFEESAA